MWVTDWWFIIQRDRRSNARPSDRITSNFLTQANWRLYEIRAMVMVVMMVLVIMVIIVVMVMVVIVVTLSKLANNRSALSVCWKPRSQYLVVSLISDLPPFVLSPACPKREIMFGIWLLIQALENAFGLISDVEHLNLSNSSTIFANAQLLALTFK